MVSIKSPVMSFKDDNHLKDYLKWWQDKLFLNDWIIHIKLVDELEDQFGTPLAGHNSFQFENKCATIRILRDAWADDRIVKHCEEQILVHELLHCKYNWLNPPETMEGKYFDTIEHQKLEEMAKSLIMVKYNLPFNWFDNTEGA